MKEKHKKIALLTAIVFLLAVMALPVGPAAAATTYTVHDPQSWGSNDIATLKFSVKMDPCIPGMHSAIVRLPAGVNITSNPIDINSIPGSLSGTAVNIDNNSFKLEVDNTAPASQTAEFFVTITAKLDNYRGVISAEIIGLEGDFVSTTIGDTSSPQDKEETKDDNNNDVTEDKTDDQNTDELTEDKAPEEDPGETPAPSHTVVFTLGSASYTINNAAQIMDTAAFAQDGRTYLPIRYAALALGVDEQNIIWDGSQQTVTLIKDDLTVQLQVGKQIMTVNDEQLTMDAGPLAQDGRIFLPLRWIANAFNATVDYNAAAQTVTLNLN